MNSQITKCHDTSRATDKVSPLLLSPREAAKVLSVCEKTLWTITQRGEIPVMRIGRLVRYPLDGLKKWIEKESEKSA